MDARRRLHASSVTGKLEAARALAVDRETRTLTDPTGEVPQAVRLAFAAVDRNRSGYLNYREVKNALRHYGIDVSMREAQTVLHAYDDRPDGKMDLHEFHRLCSDLGSGVIRTDAAPAYDAAQIPERIKRSFIAFDRDCDGHLDKSEVRLALRHYGLDASKQGAARVLAAYDRRRPDGRLDVAEFAKLVRDLEAGRVSASSEAAPARVRRTFEAFDYNRNGYLDYRELRDALRYHGIDVTNREAARVLMAYDDRPDRQLDLVEFSQLVQDLELGLTRLGATVEALGVNQRPPTPTPIARTSTASSLSSIVPPPTPMRPQSTTLRPPSATHRTPFGMGGRPALDMDDDLRVYEGDPYLERALDHRLSTTSALRRELTAEREARKLAEREASAARRLATEARRRVDDLRLSHAERSLDEAMAARRRGLGMTADNEPLMSSDPIANQHVAADVPARGREHGYEGSTREEGVDPRIEEYGLPMRELLRHRDAPHPRPPSTGVPPPSRGGYTLRREVVTLEASILAKLDGKAQSDSDNSRAAVLKEQFRAVNPRGDR